MKRFLLLSFALIVGCNGNVAPQTEFSAPRSDSRDETEQLIQDILSDPVLRAEAERLEAKDAALTRFQQANGISDRIAEAAIKEWVKTHNGDFNWNFEDVKRICLRNKRSGIPRLYLPLSEQ